LTVVCYGEGGVAEIKPLRTERQPHFLLYAPR
jgi:hypothetical protein